MDHKMHQVLGFKRNQASGKDVSTLGLNKWGSGDGNIVRFRENPRYGNKEITVSLLNSWTKIEDAGHLVVQMSSKQPELKTFLSKNKMSECWLVPLLDAVTHAITAQHQRESIKQLLICLSNSQFFDHVTSYLMEKQIRASSWNGANDFFDFCIKIMNELLAKLPRYAHIAMRVSSSLLEAAKVFSPNSKNRASIAEISVKAKEVFLIEKEKEKRHKLGYVGSYIIETPDNFVDIQVIPTEDDLRPDANPFLRSAKIDGGYKDIDHYLDIQFRLLRQDFIIPLRNGINEFKKNGCKKNFESSDLRFYFDVHICGTLSLEGIDHVLTFDVSNLKKISWELSKRFMFGSLLCLSKDNFETVLFATVAHYDVKKFEKGIVIVNFKTKLDEVFNSTFNDVYIMTETTAFFASYCPVLEGLQEMSTKLPFKDYIIHCNAEIKPPRYLLPSGGIRRLPVYDLKCIMKHNSEQKNVPVLITVRWPSAEEMCFNESQREAAQLALTKELAIIQGPPGTGKTYVGLKVIQALLENKNAMASNGDKNNKDPILVVCYTNHALDQFLEGILTFCKVGIVRVGGQSKSEKLKELTLFNWKKKLDIQFRFNDCTDLCEKISDRINRLNKRLMSLKVEIVSHQVLDKFIKDIHHYSLLPKQHFLNDQENYMNQWLGASIDDTETIISKLIRQHLTMLVLNLKTVPKHPTLSQGMGIIERAGFYHYYLDKYMQMLANRKLKHKKLSFVNSHEIDKLLKEPQIYILPDIELDKVFIEGTLHYMKTMLQSSSNTENADTEIVQHWLLGFNNNIHSQLDDIETLINHEKPPGDSYLTSYKDDALRKVMNDRMVDVKDVNAEKLRLKLHDVFHSLSYVKYRAEKLGILKEADVRNEEWETMNTRHLSSKTVARKLLIQPMTEEKENSITNIWDLKLDERYALYNLWLKRYKLSLTEELQELINEYRDVQKRKKEVDSENTLLVFKKCNVIGMTTTGAATHREVLQTLGCRIIIVEEAAEVLEAHIVTSLNQNCEHLILIGDHKQLRPNPNVYQLAKNYGLEISLFERLINNDVPHVMLKKQHRMRPEISKMIKHIYPDLEDHPSVENYENVRGIGKNIYFIQHEHQELKMEESKSKSNIFEAKFVVSLCKYLLCQDYKNSQITILTTYSGQVFEIKRTMNMSDFKSEVLVTTVDNYQGEENDIILLSLVRSNAVNKAGFLKVDNRVCVALSRAKIGFYIIGNFNFLASQSKLWKKINHTANSEKIIDSYLPVYCQNHPELKKQIRSEKDFKKCPEGGCGQPCDFKLSCGHACRLLCHGYDVKHIEYKCLKPCPKKCERDHSCKLKCYEKCVCSVIVTKNLPDCGHDNMVECHIPESSVVCSQKCSKIFDCGHQCTGTCGECKRNGYHDKCEKPCEKTCEKEHPCKLKCYQECVCYVLVTKNLPDCGHDNLVQCHIPESSVFCFQKCSKIFDCGHQCTGTCGKCKKYDYHDECEKPCEKTCERGHPCKLKCYEKCVCDVLVTKNLPDCGHDDLIQCHIPERLVVCSQKCLEVFECGHDCSGVCGQCKKYRTHKTCEKSCEKTCERDHPCKLKCYEKCVCHVMITKHLSDCGHDALVKCHALENELVCSQKCSKILDCGHPCSGVCGHCKKIKRHNTCNMPCKRTCEKDHPCRLKCSEKCVCDEIVTKHLSDCGHDNQVKCYSPVSSIACSQRCSMMLECGHQCSKRCELCKISKVHAKCGAIVARKLICGHIKEMPCNISSSLYRCQNVCGQILECGHVCTRKCSACSESGRHAACTKQCNKVLPCGHACNLSCSAPCKPCMQICVNQCRHSARSHINQALKCGHGCHPCTKECSLRCKHTKCSKLCFEICDVEPCKKPCLKKMLPCKHKCSGICGELCVCRRCSKVFEIQIKCNKSKKQNDDNGEKNGACNELQTETTLETAGKNINSTNKKDDKEILLIKIPTCNHIFYVEDLDKYVTDFDLDGSSYIPCPVCSRPILNCTRYEGINKMRSVKREARKSKLRENVQISDNQRTKLMESKLKLDNSALLKEFHSFSGTEINNFLELEIMSFQLKCAFMLHAIFSADEVSSIDIIQSIKTKVLELKYRTTTNLQKIELMLELTRCFWVCYLSYLTGYCVPEAIKTSADNEMNVQMKEIIEILKKPSLSEETLNKAELLSKTKTQRILELVTTSQTNPSFQFSLKNSPADGVKMEQTDAHFAGDGNSVNRSRSIDATIVKLVSLKKISKETLMIMKSRDEEILCDLIKENTDNTDKDEQSLHLKQAKFASTSYYNSQDNLSGQHGQQQMRSTKNLSFSHETRKHPPNFRNTSSFTSGQRGRDRFEENTRRDMQSLPLAQAHDFATGNTKGQEHYSGQQRNSQQQWNYTAGLTYTNEAQGPALSQFGNSSWANGGFRPASSQFRDSGSTSGGQRPASSQSSGGQRPASSHSKDSHSASGGQKPASSLSSGGHRPTSSQARDSASAASGGQRPTSSQSSGGHKPASSQSSGGHRPTSSQTRDSPTASGGQRPASSQSSSGHKPAPSQSRDSLSAIGGQRPASSQSGGGHRSASSQYKDLAFVRGGHRPAQSRENTPSNSGGQSKKGRPQGNKKQQRKGKHY